MNDTTKDVLEVVIWVLICLTLAVVVVLLTADSAEAWEPEYTVDNDNVAHFTWPYPQGMPKVAGYGVIVQWSDGNDTGGNHYPVVDRMTAVMMKPGLYYRIQVVALSWWFVPSTYSDWSDWITIAPDALWLEWTGTGIMVNTADTDTQIYAAPTPAGEWTQIGVGSTFVPIDTGTDRGFYRGWSSP